MHAPSFAPRVQSLPDGSRLTPGEGERHEYSQEGRVRARELRHEALLGPVGRTLRGTRPRVPRDRVSAARSARRCAPSQASGSGGRAVEPARSDRAPREDPKIAAREADRDRPLVRWLPHAAPCATRPGRGGGRDRLGPGEGRDHHEVVVRALAVAGGEPVRPGDIAVPDDVSRVPVHVRERDAAAGAEGGVRGGGRAGVASRRARGALGARTRGLRAQPRAAPARRGREGPHHAGVAEPHELRALRELAGGNGVQGVPGTQPLLDRSAGLGRDRRLRARVGHEATGTPTGTGARSRGQKNEDRRRETTR